jgi:hypothetical protein
MPRPRLAYESLPFLPNIIAETICSRPYTEQEYSQALRSLDRAAKVEALRQQMTPAQVREFAEICDARCKQAYEAGADWFMKCVKARGNRGRDQLYIWLTHWMAAYLNDPSGFKAHG